MVIDDHSRMLVGGGLFYNDNAYNFQKVLKQAVAAHGVPLKLYVDNGAQFRTHWMKRACGKLGIRLLYAKPYNPEAKGKQERYNQTADSFLREAMLAKPKSVEELNRLYQVWMEECYLHQPHSALDGRSPFEAYQADPHEIRMLSAEAITDAFLSCEKRKVDKSGCISFCGQKYEVELGLSMIHRDVDVVYDPADISSVTIECEGFPACNARSLAIASHAAQKPKLPEHYEKKNRKVPVCWMRQPKRTKNDRRSAAQRSPLQE